MSKLSIAPEDEYPDSDTELTLIRGEEEVTIRAVIHFASNIGYFVRSKKGHLLEVNFDAGKYSTMIPESEIE